MAYTRKTRDYWDIEQLCCGEWEVVNAEETWKDARRSLKEYRENQPEYPVRAKRKREKIESMVLATEPCPDCGSNHHRSCEVTA